MSQKTATLKQQIIAYWEDFQRISCFDNRWLTVLILIYFTFLLLDIFFPTYWGSALLKYVGIFLCVIYAHRKYRDDTKLIIALLLTFLADTILVWTNYYIAGVFIFCFAQFMHFLRLTKLDRKNIGSFTVIISLLVIYTALRHGYVLYALAVLYAGLLISNLVMANRHYRKNISNFHARCTWYGFLTFILCDACVGLRFIMLDGIIPANLLPLVAFLVWVFYYPSQVLLANSSLERDKSKSGTVVKTSDVV